MTIWQPDRIEGGESKAAAIADAIARDVAAGRLQPGDRLPPQRDLAYRIGVSVGTVTRAYAEAMRRGLVTGQVGSGTYVRERAAPETGFGVGGAPQDGMIDLSVSIVHCPLWREVFAPALQVLGGRNDLAALLEYQPAEGLERHRRAAAAWIERAGFAPTPDRIMVTQGGTHAIAITLSTLARPGDTVLTEPLVYPPVRVMAEMFHLGLYGVEIDGEGLRPDAFDAACRATSARVLYCVPTLQNPTGAIMSDARRREIAAIARRHDVTIVEDDVMGPLVSDAPPPLAAFASERVWFITSVSKCVGPGLRTGFIAAPRPIDDATRSRMRALGWMTAPTTAEIATTWLADGTAARLTAWLRRENAARMALARRILQGLTVAPDNDLSTHVWLTLPEPWRSGDFIAAAAERGVRIAPASAFAVSRRTAPYAVRFSLGAPPTRAALEQGLETVVALLARGPVPDCSIF